VPAHAYHRLIALIEISGFFVFVHPAATPVHALDSNYKTDSDGYIICSPEKPTISNADLRPLTLNASGEGH